ncbi:MAG: hypothetical protein WCA06_18180 [Terrimicrobiaceae bacterium]
MHRETFIAKLTEVRQTAQPLAELQALPGDSSWVLEPFVHLAPYSWKPPQLPDFANSLAEQDWLSN